MQIPAIHDYSPLWWLIIVSIGGRGTTINISKREIGETFGLPGNGMSYATKIYRPGQHRRVRRRVSERQSIALALLWFIVVAAIVLWLLSQVH
jgi:hypothetical protein